MVTTYPDWSSCIYTRPVAPIVYSKSLMRVCVFSCCGITKKTISGNQNALLAWLPGFKKQHNYL